VVSEKAANGIGGIGYKAADGIGGIGYKAADGIGGVGYKAADGIGGVEGYNQGVVASDAIPVLDYPRNLYTHVFSYRSPRGMLICGAVFLLAAFLACVPFFVPAPRGFGAIFGTGAVVFGSVAAVLGFRVINRSEDQLHFTTAGIEAHGKLVPWPRITRVAANGKESEKSVQLFYTVQLSAGFTRNWLAANGEAINPSEYEALIGLLKQELSESYPHLELGGYFSVEI
jgi:hypothetical protein